MALARALDDGLADLADAAHRAIISSGAEDVGLRRAALGLNRTEKLVSETTLKTRLSLPP